MRQGRFINEMRRIGWSGQPFLKEESLSLTHSIARYHFFLALEGSSLSPPIDIDLVYHTHQLQGLKFRYFNLRPYLTFMR